MGEANAASAALLTTKPREELKAKDPLPMSKCLRSLSVVSALLLFVASPVVQAAYVTLTDGEMHDVAAKGGQLSDDELMRYLSQSFRRIVNEKITTESMAELCRVANSVQNGHEDIRNSLYEVVCAGLAFINDSHNYDKLFARVGHALPDPDYLKPCRSCHGDGTLYDSCADCGGGGRCHRCNGSGHETFPGLRGAAPFSGPCRVCSGTGKCQRCKGAGKLGRRCSQCHGRGRVFSQSDAKDAYGAAVSQISADMGKRILSQSFPSSKGSLRGVFLTRVLPVAAIALVLYTVFFAIGALFASRNARMWLSFLGFAMIAASGWVIGSNLYRMYGWAADILVRDPLGRRIADTQIAATHFYTFFWPLAKFEWGISSLWCVGAFVMGLGGQGHRAPKEQDPRFPTLSQLRGW